ncbi:ABC tran, AAA 21, and/or MMR HSR1 domain containing protein [Asbolus verrucosus]|uniref:ABC tran, AAA 21, and/or MMR HSR1 domain containing protein n=1 Tax=Asbolus verrucosus TaxID=1661398 RepID=A0A482VAR6_ASBVE|nr:ABC tran, AAA 21, and/or MMR HSR1 domain containing protein [Asbolus verrucosus]
MGLERVERVLEYAEIKKESRQGRVTEKWPELGEVVYEQVSLFHKNMKHCILNNLNFTVRPQEKVAIVGRTGAGKSSLISSLFRLYETTGRILIDGEDIKSLSLDFLRANISITPQDPFLFTGTIRDNIDPLRIHTDEEIWSVIEIVRLKKIISNLDMKVSENDSGFSGGQKQLICLTRALLGSNKIVVLDEITANLDAEAEAFVNDIIDKYFTKCTLLLVTHKLHAINMVLEKEKIIENDNPLILLENKKSVFHKMAFTTGIKK